MGDLSFNAAGADHHPIALNFVPLQTADLFPATTGEQAQTHDARIIFTVIRNAPDSPQFGVIERALTRIFRLADGKCHRVVITLY